ncbi:MAG: YybH family protein [Pseudomonadota bacterium]
MMRSTINQDAAVRAALGAWANANRAMDIDAIMACYLPEAVSYDCHSVFQLRGAEAHRAHLAACFPHMRAPVTFDLHELSIVSNGDLAFCHFTLRCGCTGSDDKEHWVWLRASSCLRLVAGKWLIAHDHCSAPFDPVSERVMLDAGPDGLTQGKAA